MSNLSLLVQALHMNTHIDTNVLAAAAVGEPVGFVNKRRRVK